MILSIVFYFARINTFIHTFNRKETHTYMKNAYEIRLEVLQMAHSDEYNKYHHKLDTVREENGLLKDANAIDALTPKTEDILARAEELYKFVSENN